MTTTFVLTYDELVLQIQSYMERTDDKLVAQIPAIITLAENRIASEVKQQGFQTVVAGTMDIGAVGAVIAKPSFWRETISFTYTHPVNGATPVLLRALEYVKNFWPIRASLGSPRFYADYNAVNFLLAPSPDAAYPFELAYYARLQPLDSDNQTNWLTINAPQTLLFACLLEASLWAKAEDKVQKWQVQYDGSKGALLQENAERLADRSEVVTRA